MNAMSRGLFVLVVCCSVVQGEDDVQAMKKTVKGKVEEINNALIKEDYNKVADLTHPSVVKKAGGKEKMIAGMETSLKDMKSKGFSFEAVKVEEPSDPVSSDSEIFVVVPFVLQMKAPGGKLKSKSFVIGVSSDQGKSWVFVNGDLDIEKVKLILPTLPEKLKLPARQQAVFEKE